jgi:hypothetical protein
VIEAFLRKYSFVLMAGALVACSSGDGAQEPCCEGLPAGGLYATFAVGDEVIHVSITHPDGMAQARAAWSGESAANIPSGDLVCSAISWNAPWHWYMEPETVRVVEVATEVCDAAPSYVEANCASFGTGNYCPWGAELTELRDCSADPACPAVPR